MEQEGKVKILLVDDQPAKLMTYESILKDLGENLVTANSAREALELLLKDDFAVILVDVCMPDQDGFEFLQMIREHHRYRDTATIFVSAIQLTDLDHIRGYMSGAVDYVSVPVVPEILRAKVRIFLDRYRKTRALAKLNSELERRVVEQTAELRAAQEVLRKRDRNKDLFLATLGHELRGPLAPITGAVEMLESVTDAGDPSLKLATEVLKRQVSQLTRLVDDLVDLARIKENILELRKATQDLGSVLAVAIETSRPALDSAEQEVIIDVPSTTVLVDADGPRLAQVVSNLLNNACKYTPKGGVVTLWARTEGDDLWISVRDNGIGLEPAELSNVFDAFYQVRGDEGRPNLGLGIGLTLVRSIVELHGGTVEAVSAGVGKGTEVILRIPCVCEAPAELLEASEQGGTPDAAVEHRVLVADDNEDAANVLGILLQQMGCEVFLAKDGREALDIAKESRPDTLILDLGMPSIGGLEVAREVRALPWGQDATIIALTGWGQQDMRRKTEEAGFNYHLVKPVGLERLRQLLRTAEESTKTAANSDK